MSFQYRSPFLLPITVTGDVPTIDDAVVVKKRHSLLQLYCSGDDNGATGIQHVVYGFLDPNDEPIILCSINNLEAKETVGKYVKVLHHPPGGVITGIAVRQLTASGSPSYDVKLALY